jgi:glycosyltransferase involved in cell wall biosynthesis
VLTCNEAPNIERTLSKLSWLRQVIVVDSHSTDGTADIAARFPNVRVITRTFTAHAEQWNFGLEQSEPGTEWVLALDADYVLSDPLVEEIRSLEPPPGANGFAAAFEYCIDGRPLRGAAYPPVTVLYRRSQARYEQDGHTQRVRVNGHVGRLRAPIYHDDRKSLRHWLGAQARYMELEAVKLTTAAAGSLGLADRIRRWLVVAPPAMFFYCYLVRGGILDGRAGLYYSLQRATSEAILSLFLARRYTELASRPNSARRAG